MQVGGEGYGEPVAGYRVIIKARLGPGIDPSVTAATLMEQLLAFGADGATLQRDGSHFEVQLPLQARTQADALANGSRLLARSLEGEPLDDLAAKVVDDIA